MSILITPRPDALLREAARRLESIGAQLSRDEDRPDRPVVRIALSRENAAADSDLAVLRLFADLQYLVVLSDRVTDGGLEYLAGMKRLRWIALYSSSISMAGVSKLAESLPALEGVTIRRVAVSERDRAAFRLAAPQVKWR